MSESRARLRVEVMRPDTLADLEAACSAARSLGFGDDAEVLAPSLFSTSLVIVQPYVEPEAIEGEVDRCPDCDGDPLGELCSAHADEQPPPIEVGGLLP